MYFRKNTFDIVWERAIAKELNTWLGEIATFKNASSVPTWWDSQRAWWLPGSGLQLLGETLVLVLSPLLQWCTRSNEDTKVNKHHLVARRWFSLIVLRIVKFKLFGPICTLTSRVWEFPKFHICSIFAKLAKVRLTKFYHFNKYGIVFPINLWLALEAWFRFRFIYLGKDTSYTMLVFPITSHQEA